MSNDDLAALIKDAKMDMELAGTLVPYQLLKPSVIIALATELLAAREAFEAVREALGKGYGDALTEGRGRTMYLLGVDDVSANVRAALAIAKKGQHGE